VVTVVEEAAALGTYVLQPAWVNTFVSSVTALLFGPATRRMQWCNSLNTARRDDLPRITVRYRTYPAVMNRHLRVSGRPACRQWVNDGRAFDMVDNGASAGLPCSSIDHSVPK